MAFLAPIARAVTGHKVDDTIPLKTPRGDESLTVTAIRYEQEAREIAESTGSEDKAQD